MNGPLISVVTVCLNSAKTIKSTIEGMLSQTYENYEYIIKDGGSTDGTVEMVKSYMDSFNGKLKLVEKKDIGIYNAMNQGITACNGEVIGLINSDDWYAPNTLKTVADAYMKSENKKIIIAGQLKRVSPDGQQYPASIINSETYNKSHLVWHPSMFVAKSVYNEIGLYDEGYRFIADGEFMYRAYHKKIEFKFIPEILSFMREGGATDELKYLSVQIKERKLLNQKYKMQSFFAMHADLLKISIKQMARNIFSHGFKNLYYKKHS